MQTKSQLQFQILAYEDKHFESVKTLWQACFSDLEGWRAPERAIPAKLSVQRDLFLVALTDDRVIGTTMAGYDGHRGWLYCVAVLPACRRLGVASALLREAEKRLLALGCPKINLQIVTGNASACSFYRSLGYMIEERVSMGKPIGTFAQGAMP